MAYLLPKDMFVSLENEFMIMVGWELGKASAKTGECSVTLDFFNLIMSMKVF